jgi:hypothetical protein
VFKVLCSGLCYHVTWEINTYMSKVLVASIFYPEDGGSRFLCNVGTYQTIHHIENDSMFILPALRSPILTCC